MTGREVQYIAEAHRNGRLAGDGDFTRRCQDWLVRQTGCAHALLTHSCTAALEMAALLLDIQPGDEVIMPSYTFVSTANAFALRGAVPVFVDIRPDTLNIDETLIEEAITPRTKAIVPVHYAGVACEMDTIMDIAVRHGLAVVEDAAQGLMSSYKGRALGSFGNMGTLSFHETKNITCGEGGALLINYAEYFERAEIIREKGTDRSRFFRGERDKYTWQEVGSSFLPGEMVAAFLYAQMEQAEEITRERLAVWQRYHALLAPLESSGLLRRPVIPAGCGHNAHLYYILLPDADTRAALMAALRAEHISTVIHYVPLHSSPAGKKIGRAHGPMHYTDDLSGRLLRLPLWIGLSEAMQERVVHAVAETLQTATVAASAA
ncbi:MAG: dTDP-4-amino-4,6-dideoxygalactose transaminase [Pseudomonadota bacterium]|nr:dTDP-4-amino-4,6-dideoxygalactose transaminase [Pseudomonadota bacterium]